MIRFISLLLVLAGLALVGWGAMRYVGVVQPSEAVDESAPKSVEMHSAPAESFRAASDDDTFSTASTRSSMMSRLRNVPIAHETPSSARYNRSFEVTVADGLRLFQHLSFSLDNIAIAGKRIGCGRVARCIEGDFSAR